ncbi:hypothetical protein HDU96_002388 [Phlyctochytrium bullatum]|nr:hypothetical protein HDU96_002388 [Phlyctochytrium bullatum]
MEIHTAGLVSYPQSGWTGVLKQAYTSSLAVWIWQITIFILLLRAGNRYARPGAIVGFFSSVFVGSLVWNLAFGATAVAAEKDSLEDADKVVQESGLPEPAVALDQKERGRKSRGCGGFTPIQLVVRSALSAFLGFAMTITSIVAVQLAMSFTGILIPVSLFLLFMQVILSMLILKTILIDHALPRLFQMWSKVDWNNLRENIKRAGTARRGTAHTINLQGASRIGTSRRVHHQDVCDVNHGVTDFSNVGAGSPISPQNESQNPNNQKHSLLQNGSANQDNPIWKLVRNFRARLKMLRASPAVGLAFANKRNDLAIMAYCTTLATFPSLLLNVKSTVLKPVQLVEIKNDGPQTEQTTWIFSAIIISSALAMDLFVEVVFVILEVWYGLPIGVSQQLNLLDLYVVATRQALNILQAYAGIHYLVFKPVEDARLKALALSQANIVTEKPMDQDPPEDNDDTEAAAENKTDGDAMAEDKPKLSKAERQKLMMSRNQYKKKLRAQSKSRKPTGGVTKAKSVKKRR